MPKELKAVASIRYYTGSAEKRKDDFDGIWMVNALKYGSVKGYIRRKIRGQTRKFDQENLQAFLPLLHRQMSGMILDRIDGHASLVPIPNSIVTDPSSDGFKTLDLAKGIAGWSGDRLKVVPALVFAEPQPKSREGGSRNPAYLESVMRISAATKGPVVLLDDVTTTQAHFIAAYRKLLKAGANVILATAFAYSTKEQAENPMKPYDFRIDVSQPQDVLAQFFGIS